MALVGAIMSLALKDVSLTSVIEKMAIELLTIAKTTSAFAAASVKYVKSSSVYDPIMVSTPRVFSLSALPDERASAVIWNVAAFGCFSKRLRTLPPM